MLRSLPFKINTAIFTTSVIISVFFVLILYPLEITRSEEQVKRINLLLKTVFQQKVNDLANELFARQKRALQATLKDIETVDGIVGVSIYEDNGQLFVTSNAPLNDLFDGDQVQKLTDAALFTTVENEGRYYAIYGDAIEVIGKRIGFIVFFYDLSTVKQESRRSVTLIFLLPIATVLLMAVLLNTFLFKSIIRPVSMLRTAMRRVEEGRLGETVSLPAKDEIGDMGAAFNDMSRKLRDGHVALIEAEEKYRSIFENAIEGIFQYSIESGRFITVNPAMSAILEYKSPRHLIDSIRDPGTDLFVDRQDWQTFNETLEQLGQIIGFETELKTMLGGRIWTSISARRVMDHHGQPRYDEGSFIDITEQHLINAAERQREAAETASRAKSDFLAKMSHEIRTPLNAILGFADILESSITNQRQRNYVNIIRSSGVNLLNLINDILDLSKIEAGRMDIKYSAVDVRQLIEELMRLFSITAKQKNIDLHTSIPRKVPRYMLVDGARLRQVLFNLIGNAVKFTDTGSVTVHCSATRSPASRLWSLQIEITDTGAGIEKDDLHGIFQSFQQYDLENKPSEGTGLGLAISKHLIEIMNGQITVDSTPGKGSTFTITLEGVAEAAPSEDSDGNLADALYETGEEIVFAPSRLLVVDDLEINRQHIISALKNSPLTIIEAENGLTALSIIDEQRPDLIMMDIRMPGIDGYETLQCIREKTSPSIPVVAITAAGMKEDIAKLQSAGFDDYLIRPFFRTQLLKKLSRFLQHKISQHPPVRRLGEIDSGGTTTAGKRMTGPWSCPPAVAAVIHGDIIKRWKKICRRQRLPDIQTFAEDLWQLGSSNQLVVLTDYGTRLKGYADNVDIDNLQECLVEFEKIVSTMHIVS